MRNISKKQLNDFQNILINAENHNEIGEFSFDKWFSLEALGKYKNDLIISGVNCGNSIFVNDNFNEAFKFQSIYSPIIDGEKTKSIIYDIQKVTIKIKALEMYGSWVNEIPSGYSFQAVMSLDSIKNLNLPLESAGREWRLGKDWIDLNTPNYFIFSALKQLENFNLIRY